MHIASQHARLLTPVSRFLAPIRPWHPLAMARSGWPQTISTDRNKGRGHARASAVAGEGSSPVSSADAYSGVSAFAARNTSTIPSIK